MPTSRRIAVISLFPQMFDALRLYGVSGRAVRGGLLSLSFHNPVDYAKDRHRTVDGRPFGGGPGMVMLCEPLHRAIMAARAELGAAARVLCMSPQGRPLTQDAVCGMAADTTPLILIAGRYEGIDERLLQKEVDEEWSIGDYVLSGGELAAMVVLDAIIRQLPGALGNAASPADESFCGGLLEAPLYTKPRNWQGMDVPDVLLSGDHARIAKWRADQARQRTKSRRPDLLTDNPDSTRGRT